MLCVYTGETKIFIAMKNLFVLFLCSLFSILFYSCSQNDDLDCVENYQEGCYCIQVYDPVCGCNEVTYSNSCHAECNGITDYTPGECDK